MFLWLYDPYTMMALFIAYFAGFLVLNILASRIAPRIASRVSGRFSLHASMTITALIIIIGSMASIYFIYLLLGWAGYLIPLETLIFFIVAMNIFTWLLSPWLINLMYGARHSVELQEIVDEVARRAGMKPPKAMIAEGPPNAFAYGNILAGRYVAVTKPLYEILDRSELEAVIGHELGHHKHGDNAIMLLLGIFPSIIYFFGIMLIRLGLWGSMSRLSGRRESSGSGGLILIAIGIFAVMVSFIIQILVLAFSRLREYYADAYGALTSGARNLQRALAKIHLYYESNSEEKQVINHSKLRTLFIYAFTETLANPFYSYGYRRGRRYWRDIDHIVEQLKYEETDPAKEIFMSHPPIPKRLRFLDEISSIQGT